MRIISYRPNDDQFWIACSKEEAEKWFVPLLDDKKLKQYHDIQLENEDRKRHPEFAAEYEEIVKEAMHVDEVAYAYFNVSRDLTICYSDVAHHPFHQLWNGYSPFCLCDHIEINSPDQLKDIVITYEGEPFNHSSDSDSSYPDDEIKPAHVQKWYMEALEKIDTSSRLRRLISVIESSDILYILAHVIDAPFSKRDFSWEEMDSATVKAAGLLQKTVLFHVANRIADWPGWKADEVADIKLNDQQYVVLRKGFAPDWDNRYATFYHRGWFYVYRSGHVLIKFKYQKNRDGLWEMTHLYTPAKTKANNSNFEFDLIREVFHSCLWEVPLLR